MPLRFENGHWEYVEIWEYLFTYEVYNMLLNSRRGDSKDEKPNQAGHEMKGSYSAKKQYMFVGYAVLGKEPNGLFQSVRVYKNPPYSKNIAAMDEETGQMATDQLKGLKEDRSINDSFNMRQIKEHDLILLSAERIDTPGHDNDVKKVTSEDFLRSYLIK